MGTQQTESDHHSEFLTTHQRIKAYDAQRRALATTMGHPILRMARSAMPIRVSTMRDGSKANFFFARNKLIYVQRPDGAAKPADANDVERSINESGQLCITSTPAVGRKLVTIVKKARENEASSDRREKLGRTIRSLRFAQYATVSSKYAALTDLLRRKFYAPEGMDDKKLSDWSNALGIDVDPDSPVDGMRRMMLMAWDSACEPPSVKKNNPAVTICSSEETAERSSKHGGRGTTSTQFAAAKSIDEAWAAICRTDPILRQRHEISGDVMRVRVLEQRSGGFLCSIAGPPRLKEGEVMITASDDDTGHVDFATLQSFDVDDTDMRAVFTMTKKQNGSTSHGGMTAMFNVMHDHVDLFISQMPFLKPSGRVGVGQWGGSAVDDENRVRRDVPLYVSLAGA